MGWPGALSPRHQPGKSKGSAHFFSASWRGTLPLTGCVTSGNLRNLSASVFLLK